MSDLGAELQALVDRDVEEWPQMPGRLLHVLAPGVDVDVEVAAGVADRTTGEPLVPGSRFRIASVTKPFVAAAALRLVEDGRLSLDATVAMLLPGEYDELLRSGGYDTGAITLRHLLTHTSGIYDFAADAYDPSIPDGFTSQVYLDPARRWTRFEQVGFAVSHGTPYGPPGAGSGTRDTGACLVGEVLERTTGLTMGAAIRELVGYERLGLGAHLAGVDRAGAGRAAAALASVRGRVRRRGHGRVGRPVRRRGIDVDLRRPRAVLPRSSPWRRLPRAGDPRDDDVDARRTSRSPTVWATTTIHRRPRCSCSVRRSAARPGGDTTASGARRRTRARLAT